MFKLLANKHNILPAVLMTVFISGCATVNLTPNTRDKGSIPMGGNDPIIDFIVSHNTDDDNNDTVPDKTEQVPNANEDNLRTLKFNFAGAQTVALAPPQINDGSGRMAIGALVRAWKDDRNTPFPFLVPQALPLTMYFEGIENINSMDQFFFEYSYQDNQGRTVGQGLAYGTVVDVETETWMAKAGDTAKLDQVKRLLIIANAKTEANVSPANAMQVQWQHPRIDFTNPQSTLTTLTARNHASRSPDDLITFSVNFTGLQGIIVAEGPLAVVGPDSVEVTQWNIPNSWNGGNFGTTTIINNNHTVTWLSVNHPIPISENAASNTRWDLFQGKVDYRILDQFGNPIAQAPYDGADIMIREDVPLRSLVPANPAPIDNLQNGLNALIQNNTTPNWKAAPGSGVFTDSLNIWTNASTIMAIPIQITVPAGQNFISMNSHEWHVSVGKNGSVYRTRRVSNNKLAVQVSNLQAQHVQTQATYNIVLP